MTAPTDSNESRDPREQIGLVDAIPKLNLEAIVKGRYGTFSAFEREAGFSNVGQMVKGNRRMSNALLLRAAAVLNVSPLYLLDLTDEERPDFEAVAEIESHRRELEELMSDTFYTSTPGIGGTIASKTHWEGDTEREPSKVFESRLLRLEVDDPSPVYVRITVAAEIKNIPGDYRDLRLLAGELLDTYPQAVVGLLTSPPITSTGC